MVLTFQVMFRPEPEGGFTVSVPSLPGCISYGETLDEAKSMIQEAATLYVEAVREKNGKIDDDSQTFESQLQIALSA